MRKLGWVGAEREAPGAGFVSEATAPFFVRASLPPAPLLVPPGLLEHRAEGVPREVLETEILRLGACEARLDLDLGRALTHCTQPEANKLGFSSLETFFPEVLGFSSRVASELKTVSKRLDELPLLREAFLSGAIPRSKVRIALSVATPETDEAWVLACARHGTRKLQAMARSQRTAASASVEEAPPDFVRVSLRVRASDRSLLETVGLPMLRAVVGVEGPRHVLMEALAADALSDLGHEDHAACGDRRCGDRRKPVAVARVANQSRRLLHRVRATLGGLPAVAWIDVVTPPSSPREMETRLRRLVSWKHAIEWQRARLLRLLHRETTPSFAWLEQRLGLAPVEVKRLLRLEWAVQSMPEMEWAWREGRIGSWTLSTLLPILTPENAADWLRLHECASRKRLEAEVAACLAVRSRPGPRIASPRPRWSAPMSALRSKWDVEVERVTRRDRRKPPAAFNLHGELTDQGACEADLLGAAPAFDARTTFGFLAPASTATLIADAVRKTSQVSGGALDEGRCVRRMLAGFIASHVVEGLEDLRLRARVLRRDGWQCAMPRCRARRHLNVHHVIFRSQRGSDDESNLLTLCSRCHRLLHEGWVRVEGLAPDGLLVRMGLAGDAECFREGLRVRAPPASAARLATVD